jgi:hypothetical protein
MWAVWAATASVGVSWRICIRKKRLSPSLDLFFLSVPKERDKRPPKDKTARAESDGSTRNTQRQKLMICALTATLLLANTRPTIEYRHENYGLGSKSDFDYCHEYLQIRERDTFEFSIGTTNMEESQQRRSNQFCVYPFIIWGLWPVEMTLASVLRMPREWVKRPKDEKTARAKQSEWKGTREARRLCALAAALSLVDTRPICPIDTDRIKVVVIKGNGFPIPYRIHNPQTHVMEFHNQGRGDGNLEVQLNEVIVNLPQQGPVTLAYDPNSYSPVLQVLQNQNKSWSQKVLLQSQKVLLQWHFKSGHLSFAETKWIGLQGWLGCPKEKMLDNDGNGFVDDDDDDDMGMGMEVTEKDPSESDDSHSEGEPVTTRCQSIKEYVMVVYDQEYVRKFDCKQMETEKRYYETFVSDDYLGKLDYVGAGLGGGFVSTKELHATRSAKKVLGWKIMPEIAQMIPKVEVQELVECKWRVYEDSGTVESNKGQPKVASPESSCKVDGQQGSAETTTLVMVPVMENQEEMHVMLNNASIKGTGRGKWVKADAYRLFDHNHGVLEDTLMPSVIGDNRYNPDSSTVREARRGAQKEDFLEAEPKCVACQLGKHDRNTKPWVPERVLDAQGSNQFSRKYKGGTIFYDAATGRVNLSITNRNAARTREPDIVISQGSMTQDRIDKEHQDPTLDKGEENNFFSHECLSDMVRELHNQGRCDGSLDTKLDKVIVNLPQQGPVTLAYDPGTKAFKTLRDEICNTVRMRKPMNMGYVYALRLNPDHGDLEDTLMSSTIGDNRCNSDSPTLREAMCGAQKEDFLEAGIPKRACQLGKQGCNTKLGAIEPKLRFKREAVSEGVPDTTRNPSKNFTRDLHTNEQVARLSDQNGLAENSICHMVRLARTMMIHAAVHVHANYFETVLLMAVNNEWLDNREQVDSLPNEWLHNREQVDSLSDEWHYNWEQVDPVEPARNETSSIEGTIARTTATEEDLLWENDVTDLTKIRSRTGKLLHTMKIGTTKAHGALTNAHTLTVLNPRTGNHDDCFKTVTLTTEEEPEGWKHTKPLKKQVMTRKRAKFGSGKENGSTASTRKRAALRSSEEDGCTISTRKRTTSTPKAKHIPTVSVRKQAHNQTKRNLKFPDAFSRTQAGVPYFGYKIAHLKEAEWIKRAYGDAFELPDQVPKYKVRPPNVERRRLYPKRPVLKALLNSKEWLNDREQSGQWFNNREHDSHRQHLEEAAAIGTKDKPVITERHKELWHGDATSGRMNTYFQESFTTNETIESKLQFEREAAGAMWTMWVAIALVGISWRVCIRKKRLSPFNNRELNRRRQHLDASSDEWLNDRELNGRRQHLEEIVTNISENDPVTIEEHKDLWHKAVSVEPAPIEVPSVPPDGESSRKPLQDKKEVNHCDKSSLLDSKYGVLEDNFTPSIIGDRPFLLKASKGDPDTPTLWEAMIRNQKEGFLEAADKEIAGLEKYSTWTEIKKSDVPEGRKVLPGIWELTIKRFPDGRFRETKARYCTRGDHQVKGVNYYEKYAPVVQRPMVRFLLALTHHLKWSTMQVDFEAAFVQATIKEDVYLTVPQVHGDNMFKEDCCLKQTVLRRIWLRQPSLDCGSLSWNGNF